MPDIYEHMYFKNKPKGFTFYSEVNASILLHWYENRTVTVYNGNRIKDTFSNCQHGNGSFRRLKLET